MPAQVRRILISLAITLGLVAVTTDPASAGYVLGNHTHPRIANM